MIKEVQFFRAPTENKSEEECQAILRRCGFYRIYVHATWDKVEMADDIKKFLEKEYFIQKQDYPRGIFITGSVGIGKTSLCALIGKFFIKSWRIIPRFISTGNLFDMYFERKQSEVEELMHSTILFLDDLGREYGADFPVAKFENFIEYRYGNLLPTFITSNLTLEDLRARPMFERIADRINDPRWMKHLILVGASKRNRDRIINPQHHMKG